MASSSDNTEFIKFEKKKLDELKNTLTPEEGKVYKEEILYIEALLDELSKAKSKKDEKKIKDRIQGNLTKLVNNFSFKKMSDITHKELPAEAIEDAKLIEIGTKYYKMNGIDSDNYVAQMDNLDKNWKIDEDLSSDKGLVVHNEKTNKTKIAYRGTDAKGMNLNDIQTDAQIYAGTEGTSTHFQEAQQQAQDVITKYGKENLSITGYSLGGNKSLAIGQAYDIPSTGFNSFIGKNLVNKPDTFTGTRHQIWRTREDLPSIQSAYLKGKSNIDVNVVSTRGGLGRSMNPYSAHALNNFTSNTDRHGANDSIFINKTHQLVEHATKHGELSILDDMIQYNKQEPLNKPAKTPYQKNLDIKAKSLPKVFPPRSTDNLRESVVDKGFRQLLDRERVSVSVNPLVEGIKRNPAYIQDPLNYQPRQIARNKFVEPLQMDLGANTGNPELDDLLRFTQDQLTKKPLKFKRNIEPNTRVKLTGLRNKTKLEPTAEGRLLDTQMNRLESRITIPTAEVVGNYNLGIPRAGLKPAARYTLPPTEGIPAPLNIKKPSTQSFTKYAIDNGIDPNSDHHKILWKKSGGTLTSEESKNFNEDHPTANTDDYLNEFVSKDGVDRGIDLLEHSQTQNTLETEINNFDSSNIRASDTGMSYAGEIARGVHPSNLIVGLGSAKLSDVLMKKYVDPYQQLSSDSDIRTGEEGALTGAITSTVLGTAMLPEAVAGATGYVVGKEATGGIYKGLKSLGANEDVSTSLADIGGGAAGGAAAGLTGTIAASALAGSAIGPEGTVIGAGVGALMGGAAYGLGKLGIGGNEYTDYVSPDSKTGITTLDFSDNNN